ncbi:MAG: hypothetical protein ABIG63_19445, partial [Chloroflexota bacterium]
FAQIVTVLLGHARRDLPRAAPDVQHPGRILGVRQLVADPDSRVSRGVGIDVLPSPLFPLQPAFPLLG